jgi:peroxiredoxin Q/BCP
VPDNKAFKDHEDLPFDLLCDTGKTMSIAYGAADAASSNASRISYLVDAEGKVQKVYESVSPADHPEEVLRDLG